jgi:hypothetical protein
MEANSALEWLIAILIGLVLAWLTLAPQGPIP